MTITKSLSDDATKVAAKATGLRPDQIEAAVEEYRKAADALHQEPEWNAILFFSMRGGGGIGQYGDPDGQTKVTLQIETGKSGPGVKVYVLDGKPFETYGEARTAELLIFKRPKPRATFT